jgi:hypothetical protein
MCKLRSFTPLIQTGGQFITSMLSRTCPQERGLNCTIGYIPIELSEVVNSIHCCYPTEKQNIFPLQAGSYNLEPATLAKFPGRQEESTLL